MEHLAALSSLVLYDLRLILELGEGRQRLPRYLGSTLRGVFAAAFRSLVCVTQAPVCTGCALLHRCPYPYVFETPPPPYLPVAMQKRFAQAPRPYIFHIPMEYTASPTLEIGLVLVGRALDYLPYFLYVLQETGRQGLGRARVPYRLRSVHDGADSAGPAIWRHDAGIVQDAVQGITLESLRQPDDAAVQDLTLEFLTPLRVKKYGGYQSGAARLGFATLCDLLIGRLAALALFHCGATWTPQESWREAARHIDVVEHTLTLQHLERYSNRHHHKLPLHGLVGSLRLAGALTPFLPLLRLCQLPTIFILEPLAVC